MIRRTQIKRTRIKPKAKRNPMPAGRRLEVFERDGSECRNCEYEVSWNSGKHYSGHAHHIIFKSQGGTHDMENLILLCMICHDMIHARQLFILGNADTAEFTNTNPRKGK